MPFGYPSDGTSDGYTSWPCSATSPISMFFSDIRKGMKSPTNLSSTNVTSPVQTITHSAAKNCHFNNVRLPWTRPATPPEAIRPCLPVL
jgi:hypothetical protein